MAKTSTVSMLVAGLFILPSCQKVLKSQSAKTEAEPAQKERPLNPKDATICATRLKKWNRCYKTEVRIDDGISDWTARAMDQFRQELYVFINDMGGVFVDKKRRRSIKTCTADRIAFFSVPQVIKGKRVPGVLLVEPAQKSGYGTFFAIDAKGRLAIGAIDFKTAYCTGGGFYTPDVPGVVFTTADRKEEQYFQLRITPQKKLPEIFAANPPAIWKTVERELGHQAIFYHPIVHKELGPMLRLKKLSKSGRRVQRLWSAQKQP